MVSEASAMLSDADEALPLLKDRKALGPVTTYVCENFTCQAPIIGTAALKAAL